MRRRTYSRTPKSFRPRIFWSANHLAYGILTPYNEAYKDELKQACSLPTKWEPDAKVWIVQEPDLDQAKTLVKKYFGDFDFVPRPQYGTNTAASITNGTNPYKTMFELADLEIANDFYRKLLKKHHPDTGGTHENATKINTAWRDIKQELFKP